MVEGSVALPHEGLFDSETCSAAGSILARPTNESPSITEIHLQRCIPILICEYSRASSEAIAALAFLLGTESHPSFLTSSLAAEATVPAPATDPRTWSAPNVRGLCGRLSLPHPE